MRLLAVLLISTACTAVRAAESDQLLARSGAPSPGSSTPVKIVRSSCPCGTGWIAETANFRVFWCTSPDNLRELAEHCERMAEASKDRWLGSTHKQTWVPRCDIVVYNQGADYVRSLGPRSEQTSGCATIRLDQGRVVVRRIDLRADAADWRTESLPHELTHVVLADRFSTRRITPWADEGIAMLAESPEKLALRLKDLRQVVASGATYSVRDLMNVRTCPEPASRAAFYGQSVALTSFLLEWGTREQLLRFVEIGQIKGTDAALHEVYGAQRSARLEPELRNYILTDRLLDASHQRMATVSMPPTKTAAME